MIENMYEKAKKHWESIKPIRGRVVDTRPAFRRHRAHETIRLNEKNGDVEFVLYETACFIVHPDNSFSLAHGGWITPSTSSFIKYCLTQMGWIRRTEWSAGNYQRSVWAGIAGVWKDRNQLWLIQQTENNMSNEYKRWEDIHLRYPIGKEPTRYKWDDKTNAYTPTAPVHIKVKAKRTDKAKSKRVLDGLKPFRKYVATVTKLNDGGPLGVETVAQYFSPEFSAMLHRSSYHHFNLDTIKSIKAHMESDNSDDWLKVLVGASVSQYWDDERFGWGDIDSTKVAKGRIDRAIKKMYDLEKEVVLDKYVGADT